MRYGVVIGCVGVVAAVATAIGVYTKPAAPSATPLMPAANVQPVARPGRLATVKPAPKMVRADAPVAVVPAGALPAAYRVLLSRSIFCPRAIAGKAGAATAESAIALRGVMQWGRGLVAFVENTASGEARLVHVGDAVGRGKITAIDLHYVEFIQGKRAIRIAVGQNFSGESSRIAVTGSALATTHTIVD